MSINTWRRKRPTLFKALLVLTVSSVLALSVAGYFLYHASLQRRFVRAVTMAKMFDKMDETVKADAYWGTAENIARSLDVRSRITLHSEHAHRAVELGRDREAELLYAQAEREFAAFIAQGTFSEIERRELLLNQAIVLKEHGQNHQENKRLLAALPMFEQALTALEGDKSVDATLNRGVVQYLAGLSYAGSHERPKAHTSFVQAAETLEPVLSGSRAAQGFWLESLRQEALLSVAEGHVEEGAKRLETAVARAREFKDIEVAFLEEVQRELAQLKAQKQ